MAWTLRLGWIGAGLVGCLAGCSSSSPACENGVLDPGEASVDCGGTCPLCADGTACTEASACASGACTGGFCTAPACDDEARNGDETDVDCGGSCPSCAVGESCVAGADCVTGVCTRDECAAMTCIDGVQNGDETGVDCGGSCPPCAPGQRCLIPDDCDSGVCTAEVCAEPACDDEVQNGTESDVDCGGTCAPCALGARCALPSDCVTDACSSAGQCVNGPVAGFEVAPTQGEAPHSIRVTSMATAGDAAIATIEYDYGSGLELDEVHTFVEPGVVAVRQRVTDAVGAFDEATVMVEVLTPSFVPVRLSETDRTPSPDLELTEDRLGIKVLDLSSGARTDRSISSGEGIFYAEGRRLSALVADQYFGVVTAGAPLTVAPGADDVSIGVDTSGSIQFGGAVVTAFPSDQNEHYGFVVDYRGAQPVVHVVLRANVDQVRYSATLNTTDPVFFMTGGSRRSLDVQSRIIVGNDLTRFPFRYDPVAVLAAASIAAPGLVLGWGQTRTLPPNDPPILDVMTMPMTVTPGTRVPLSAVASDVLDGDLTSEILWENLTVAPGERPNRRGGSFSFSATEIGVYPIRATVVDRVGQAVSATVDITVSGSVPAVDPVVLAPDARSGDVTLTGDGLGVSFNGPTQVGVRANQALYGAFWYFEATRTGVPGDFAVGVAVGSGALNPYEAATVAGSCSINSVASIYRSLMFVDNYNIPSTTTYGVAVDYRGRSPIVYLITNTPGGPELTETLELDDVTLPVYPFAYGRSNPATGADLTFNFGPAPFVYDPATVLAAASVDASGLEAGWGAANLP